VKRTTWGVVLGMAAAAAGGAGLWWLQQDDFDYAAAFERPEAVETQTAPGVVLAVAALAGRSEAEVARTLGDARCEDALHSRRCRYDQVSVTFVEGRAEWLLADFGGSGYTLAPATLAALGLPEAPPQHRSPREMRWQDLAGFGEVRLFADTQGIVTHALVKLAAR